MTERPSAEAEMVTAVLISVITRTCQEIFKDMPEETADLIAKKIVLDVASEGFSLYFEH